MSTEDLSNKEILEELYEGAWVVIHNHHIFEGGSRVEEVCEFNGVKISGCSSYIDVKYIKSIN